MTTEHDIINNALEVLRAAGMKQLEEECQGQINKFTAIGLAIASVEQAPIAMGRLAHEYWEAHNDHHLAGLLRWIFPEELNPDHYNYLMDEAQFIQHLIEREHIMLLDTDGKARGYTVTVRIEEQHIDMIASGYEWICPHCKHLNHEIEARHAVQCGQCASHFKINPPEHAYE